MNTDPRQLNAHTYTTLLILRSSGKARFAVAVDRKCPVTGDWFNEIELPIEGKNLNSLNSLNSSSVKELIRTTVLANCDLDARPISEEGQRRQAQAATEESIDGLIAQFRLALGPDSQVLGELGEEIFARYSDLLAAQKAELEDLR